MKLIREIVLATSSTYILVVVMVSSTTLVSASGHYHGSCTSSHPCNVSRNLTCDLEQHRCICATHPDQRYVYTYKSATEACVPVLKFDLDAFSYCQDVIRGRGATLPAGGLGYCRSHFDCRSKLGIPYSRCHLHRCECECETNDGQNLIKASGSGKSCVITRNHGDACANNEECDSDNNMVCDQGGHCACKTNHVWGPSKQKCVLIATKCEIDEQCSAENSYGQHSRCAMTTKSCVCKGKARMYNGTCALVREPGESCEQDVDCLAGLGEGRAACVDGFCECADGHEYEETRAECVLPEPTTSAPDMTTPKVVTEGSTPPHEQIQAELPQTTTVVVHLEKNVHGGVSETHAIITFVLVVTMVAGGMLSSWKVASGRRSRPGQDNLLALQDMQQRSQLLQQISRSQFTVDTKVTLGRGKGGIVHVGMFGSASVAIKTLNPACQRVDAYLDSMYQEIEIFKSLPKNEHVVNVLAYSYVCVPAARPGRIPVVRECFILMELCALGSLKDFLTKTDYSAGPEDVVGYCEADLLNFACQVVQGAEFLAAQRVVHGDLACRNVLLDSNRIAKITDFGLARRLEDSPTYIKTAREFVPWKWSPPEVLQHNKFSIHSDVWSCGVVLWEIFSRGSEPYQGVFYSAVFPAELYQGLRRLPQPRLASIHLYRVMKKCWRSEPDHRIGFEALRLELNKLAQHPIPDAKLELDRVAGSHEKGPDGYLV